MRGPTEIPEFVPLVSGFSGAGRRTSIQKYFLEANSWTPIRSKPNNSSCKHCNAAARRERDSLLKEACGDDQALRHHVDMLVQAHEYAGTFLEKGALAASPSIDQPAIEKAGHSQIGPYKLLQQIGEGGMGVVYMAEQTEPVQRKVALKVIKPGMDSRQVIARFEAERQALAMMDHVNIARVLRCRRHGSRPALLRHGTGPRRARSPSTATTTT